MKLLQSKKHVFWEALVLTIIIFLVGFLFGIYIEKQNLNILSDYSIDSETNLIDGMAIIDLSKQINLDCSTLVERNIEYADKIYLEAKLLEKYEESGKLTESMKILHRKYDMLRTLAWISNSNTLQKCKDFTLVIYLYEYEPQNINTKAIQAVWSRKLTDLKANSENMILLPIAVDKDLTSLKMILKNYNITQYPALIVNDRNVLYDVDKFNINAIDNQTSINLN